MVKYGASVVWTHTTETLVGESSTRPVRTRGVDLLLGTSSK